MISNNELEILKNNTIQLQELSEKVSILAKQSLEHYQNALTNTNQIPINVTDLQVKNKGKLKKKSFRKKRKI